MNICSLPVIKIHFLKNANTWMKLPSSLHFLKVIIQIFIINNKRGKRKKGFTVDEKSHMTFAAESFYM